MILKRVVCLFLCLYIIMCICGCKQGAANNTASQNATSSPSQSNPSKTMSLLYCYGDSFNPYTAKTAANRQLALLMYDSLVKTDNNFDAVYTLAQSVDSTDKVCTVKLREATFTDGSPVTADDVIYSYNLAKESARYAHNFYEIVSVTAVDSKTISFELSQHDPYFANLLNFPIIKSNTAGITDADGKETPPVGCGRYVLSEDSTTLKQNKNYYGKKGVVATINLINSPDASSTSHYVEVGATDAYYTEDENIVRMSGKKTDVNLNRLIYIGINSNYGSLATKEMRYAISSALDREAVCRTAYYNKAMSATGFFNPFFEATSAVQTIESKPNSKITVENLAKIGYNNMNSNGYYANEAGNNPVFTLLVNSENASRVTAANLIAEQCKTAGIQINVVECSYEQYLKRLTTGDFQLYIGEVQILNNMDFTQLVTPGGSAAYGVGVEKVEEEETNSTESPDANDETVDTPDKGNDQKPEKVKKSICQLILESYHAGECGIGDVAGTLITEMPQIPVCYLNGVMFYSSTIRSGVQASTGDIYFNIENYEF